MLPRATPPVRRFVLACELVAAVRALRLHGSTLGPGPLCDAYERAASALAASTADRPLDDDLALAQELLPGFGLGA